MLGGRKDEWRSRRVSGTTRERHGGRPGAVPRSASGESAAKYVRRRDEGILRNGKVREEPEESDRLSSEQGTRSPKGRGPPSVGNGREIDRSLGGCELVCDVILLGPLLFCICCGRFGELRCVMLRLVVLGVQLMGPFDNTRELCCNLFCD